MDSEAVRLKRKKDSFKICLIFQNHDNYRQIQGNTTEAKMGIALRFKTDSDLGWQPKLRIVNNPKEIAPRVAEISHFNLAAHIFNFPLGQGSQRL